MTETPACSSRAGRNSTFVSMFDELVAFVRGNYSRARKIIEVGAGSRIEIAERIKESLPLAEVLVTDKDASSIRSHRTKHLRAVADDVMFPHTQIYQGASLIYSIHPPVEIIPAMMELATAVKADLLVVPRSDEQEAFERERWEKITWSGRTLGWRRVSGETSRMA